MLDKIERLYAGPAGVACAERSQEAISRRGPFWATVALATRLGPGQRVLEVGCGRGSNLALLGLLTAGATGLYGIDVNRTVLATTPANGVAQASAARLPFLDRSFDLVFTCGLLMHIPLARLDGVLDELVRVSCRYVATIEYEDEVPAGEPEREIPWRDQRDVLWSRPQSWLLWQRHPALRLVSRWPIPANWGFARCLYALFEQTG